jgi:hypothetical protein
MVIIFVSDTIGAYVLGSSIAETCATSVVRLTALEVVLVVSLVDETCVIVGRWDLIVPYV